MKAELGGSQTTVQENIRLTTTVKLTVVVTLEEASVAEEITVLAKAPSVDIRSAESASVTLSEEVLRNVP